MKYANKIHNKPDRRISIRALLLMLALMTTIAIPTQAGFSSRPASSKGECNHD